MCQSTDLQTEEGFVIEKSLLEDADFPLRSTFIDKNISGEVAVLTSKLKVYSKKIVIKLIWLNHLKHLENELLDKSKDNYQLREKFLI